MTNRLKDASSPYLRQHQDNPVDWYTWSEEALTKAKIENKPIFLSIGYAACHWCHVMAHESFEDPHTASILNEHFISIKVDREERPDLDDIYMRAVVALTGRGGWPMSVFLTPDLKPFYGGTYFPPISSYGMPSFTQVLMSVIDVWHNNPQGVQKNAQVLTNAVQSQFQVPDETDQLVNLDSIVQNLYQNYDWQKGGWGNAPKFPQAMLVQFLIQRAMKGDHLAEQMAIHALDHMAQGGMYDIVGGGFHRYSTDVNWLVPHFEKMLYDNALLAQVYLHAFALTGDPVYKHVATNTLGFLLQELSHPDGGFYASLDADTVDGEGRYYAWRMNALKDALSQEQLTLLQNTMKLSEEGNFEDGLLILRYKDNLHVLAEKLDMAIEKLLEELSSIFSILRKARKKLAPPTIDNKIITSWNTMTIQAFTEAGLLLEQDSYLTAAKDALNFLLTHLQDETGNLMRSWSQGKANNPGTLADYAGLILALHDIYEVDFSPSIFNKLREVFRRMCTEFSGDGHLYFDTQKSLSDLILRPRNLQDNAVPSGNALAAHAHWLVAQYEHDTQSQEQFLNMVKTAYSQAGDHPFGFGYWLEMADLMGHPAQQIALISSGGLDKIDQFLKVYRNKYRPESVIAARYKGIDESQDLPSLLADRKTLDNLPTAYVCLGHTCLQPTSNINQFEKQLDSKNQSIP
ncbi:MAG: thioredoxin domain-containing protein [Brevefilum sp.]|nr:thioredoxin domain-containing protein [Brevefilum sp.]MDT8380889.1 thioredoxin domain-containing protein [Brevefilum sp.]MDW7755521.1 thioredoxin domain-containing protein [Brevefilum sp.]